MAKNTLEIIIKANTTQAQAALRGLQTTIGKPFAGLKQSVSGLGTAFQSMTGFSLGAAGAFAAIGIAASKAADFIKSSVASTIAYGQSVRELSQIIGVNSEETSRLIQVADDYLISVGQLTTALRFATKNGFAPTVESLAQLADRFNSISDPTQRAAEMVKIFGRNWSALVPMLKAGGDEIRANAAAIEQGLILDDTDTAMIFEYQQAVDGLQDSWGAFTTGIGISLIPLLTDLANALQTAADALSADRQIINDTADTLHTMGLMFGEATISANTFGIAMSNAVAGGFIDFEGNYVEQIAAIADEIAALKTPAEQAAAAQRYFGDEFGIVLEMLKLGGGYFREVATSEMEATAATAALNSQLKPTAEQLQALADAAKEAQGELADYAKAIEKAGLSTAKENDLINQFAASLGLVDTTALLAANDQELLNAAWDAGVISLDKFTQISLEAATGTGELSDATVQYLKMRLPRQRVQRDWRPPSAARPTQPRFYATSSGRYSLRRWRINGRGRGSVSSRLLTC